MVTPMLAADRCGQGAQDVGIAREATGCNVGWVRHAGRDHGGELCSAAGHGAA